MQRKLALKLSRLVTTTPVPGHQFCLRMRNLGATTGGWRTADPAIHAVAPEEKDDASQAALNPTTTHPSEFKPTQLKVKDDDTYAPPKKPSYPLSESTPKLQSTGVNQPPEPITPQKRRRSCSYSNGQLKEADCAAGLDGTLWPEDKQQQLDRQRQREEQVRDNKEYFQHRKASPLSELEMADTRKPITRATDGTAGSYYQGAPPDLVLWRPEQVDTAEDSLRRAMEIWKSNAMRGDPDSPHGRILRTLRGEDW